MSSNPFINQGVSRGRILPDPVQANTAMGPINANVPFVTPPPAERVEADTSGALSLARAMGGINFGLLGMRWQAQKEAREKMAREADEQAGLRDASMFLNRAGRDYYKLQNSGALRPHQTPGYRVGVGIAVAQSEFMALRKLATEELHKNPDVDILGDPAHLEPFLNNLRGVAPEAANAYFFSPLQKLRDSLEGERQRALGGRHEVDTIGRIIQTATMGIEAGDPLGSTINNALNLATISQLNDPSFRESLVKGLAPALVRSASGPDGSVDFATLHENLNSLYRVNLDERFGGQTTFGGRFSNEFMALQNSIYASSFTMNQSITQQKTRMESEKFDNFYKDLYTEIGTGPDGQPESPEWVKVKALATKHGIPPQDAIKAFNQFSGIAGAASREDLRAQSFLSGFGDSINTPAGQKAAKEAATRAHMGGKMSPGVYSATMSFLSRIGGGSSSGSSSMSLPSSAERGLLGQLDAYAMSVNRNKGLLGGGTIGSALKSQIQRSSGIGNEAELNKHASVYNKPIAEAMYRVVLNHIGGTDALAARLEQAGGVAKFDTLIPELYSSLPTEVQARTMQDIFQVIQTKPRTQWMTEFSKIGKPKPRKVSMIELDQFLASSRDRVEHLPEPYLERASLMMRLFEQTTEEPTYGA